MSFLANGVSRGQVNGAGEPAQDSKKEDQKSSLATNVVLSTLTQQSLSTLSLDPIFEASPAKKKEAVQNIMNLKPVKFQREKFNVPPLSLKLSSQETHLVNSMFSSITLNQQISLLDLWGVDLFMHLEKMLQFFPGARSQLMDDFCANFILGTVSIMFEAGGKKADDLAPKLKFYERDKSPADAHYLVMTRSEWACCLGDLKKSLNALMSQPKGKLKTIREHFKAVQGRLDLGCKLLQHPDALLFLRDFNLLSLGEYFPKSAALNEGSAEKGLADLTTYVRFLDTGFAAGCNLGKLSVKTPVFSEFLPLLSKLSGNKNPAPAAQNVKSHLANVFVTVFNMNNELMENYILAVQGKLTHEAYCKTNGIQIRVKKSQKEFAESLYFKFGQVNLANAFAHDCLDIFDQRIMEPLFPDTFVTTAVGFNRLAANLSHFFQLSAGVVPTQAAPASPPLPPDKAALLKTLIEKIHTDLNTWMSAVDQESLLEATQTWQEMNREARIFYNQWLPFIAKCQPAVLAINALIPSLENLRKKHLGKIEEFLNTCDPTRVRQYRSEWTHYFQEVCFLESLNFCRFTMLANDMRAVLSFETDLNAMSSEEHLLPEPLVDFMTLEGIEEVLNKFLPPGRPMAEDLEDKPVRLREAQVQAVALAKIAKPDNKKAHPPRQAPVPQAEPEIFRIRRGEKTRKILQRLREMGFLPTSARRGGTSHLKLESKEGKQAIVPMHTHQKRGTARSIDKQVR